MKIQQTQNLQLNNRKIPNANENNSKVAFTGAEVFTEFLRFLDTNPFWGATFVDLGSMGIPRTTVDFTRSPEAGLETARREGTSTGNDALIGIYGLGAGYLLSRSLNSDFGIKAHKMFISDETLDILSHTWNEQKNTSDPLNRFLTQIMNDVKGFNPEHLEKSRIDEKGWVKLDKATQKDVVQKLTEEIKTGSDSLSKEAKAYLKSVIATSVGVERNFKIEKTVQGKELKSVSPLDAFIDNVYKSSKAFTNDKVAGTFKSGNIADSSFIKGMKKLNRNTAILGVGLAAAVGMCAQPFNRYLTKKKTGKDDFVGGGKKDNSTKFKVLKTTIASLFAVGALGTIGKFSELLSNIQFKGLVPTISQFKFAYGLTIFTRLLSSANNHELRESTFKDTLGFANWLILGGFVSKLTAAGFEKLPQFKNKGEKFILYNEAENGKSWFKWLTNSSLVTRDEILFTELKKAGISAIKDGKAMKFREMLKIAPEFAKTKIKYLNMVQFAGYLYSGLVLGVGVPKLNIAITKAVEKRHHHKHKHECNEKKCKPEEIKKAA